MGFVEDVDLVGELARRILDALPNLADGVYASVRGGVDLIYVECSTLANGDARRTGITRFAVDQLGAVDCLCEDAGQRGFAGPTRPDEQDAVGHAIGPDGVAQRFDHHPLPDDLTEGLGAPASIDGLMLWSRTHDAPANANETKDRAAERIGRPQGRVPCTLHRFIASAPTAKGSSDQALPRHPTNIA